MKQKEKWGSMQVGNRLSRSLCRKVGSRLNRWGFKEGRSRQSKWGSRKTRNMFTRGSGWKGAG